MKYHDKLQARLSAKILKCVPHIFKLDEDQLIGMIMLDENLFYDEAKGRYQQVIASFRKLQ